MVRMNNVSEICEIDIITEACCTIKLLANSGSLSKLCRKGVAKHVSDLQFRAQHHGEDEENRHPLIF